MTSSPPPDGFALIKPGQTYLGKQGIVYGAGASKETVGAQNICMNVMPMPPGAVASARNTIRGSFGESRRVTWSRAVEIGELARHTPRRRTPIAA